MSTPSTTLSERADARERTFLIEELFFSTTDRKGIIRSGNDVFVRVAAYSEEELVGSPHNIIRHPDMPRAVFQLLWDEILAGRPIAAYVKNRAKDGAYYWVMAVVVPADDGFLSVRLKPTSAVFDAVQGLYRELRALELSIESGEGKARKRAIAASTELLGTRLHELGHESYQSFMRVALVAELAAREEAMARAPGRAGDAGNDELLVSVRDGVGAVLGFLDVQFADLNGYVELNTELSRKSGFVGELAAAIRLFSLNALIGATRLGSGGAALSEVAHLMGVASIRVEGILGDLESAIAGTVEVLTELVFAISVCKLQAEMTVVFARDLLGAGGGGEATHDARVRADVGLLVRSVTREMTSIASALAALNARLHDVSAAGQRLGRVLGELRALQMNGRIEAAAFGGDAGARDVEALFRRIREELDEATEETEGVEAIVRRAALSRRTRESAGGHVDRLFRLDAALAE